VQNNYDIEFQYMPCRPVWKKFFDWNRYTWWEGYVLDLGGKREANPEDPNRNILEMFPGLSGQKLQIARFLIKNGPSTANQIFLATGIKPSSSIISMKRDKSNRFVVVGKSRNGISESNLWKYIQTRD